MDVTIKFLNRRCISIHLPYQFSLDQCPDIPSFCFMDKGTGQTCAFVLPHWADGGNLLVPVPLPAILLSGGRLELLPANISEYLIRIIVFLFLGKRMYDGEYLLADYYKCLHLTERILFPCLQVVI